MKATEARYWFDQIVESAEGGEIRIPCDSKAEADSARAQFYRERNHYISKLGAVSKDIGIKRITVSDNLVDHFNGKHFVVLTVGKKRTGVTMTGPDGVKTTLAPFVEVNAEEELYSNGLTMAGQRHYDLMISDGHSEEEAMEGALASQGAKT